MGNLPEKLWNLKKKFSFNGSNNPKNKEDLFYYSDSNRKKKAHKDVKIKTEQMKNKIIQIQNEIKATENTVTNESFSSKRKWDKTIEIKDNKQSLSYKEQLDRLDYEYNAYDNQTKKFKKIIKDINEGKEKFYPEESKLLFNEYIDIIKFLKSNIKSMKNNLKKNN